ncbi:serine O-acetyltransferase [Flavobacterium flavipallidum]|uniref:Serine acetyltransferase n=1 Tax=Flavobacterium flavipallidum TaxID=3139140 RepID=A0ABU9HJ83_9FLAO
MMNLFQLIYSDYTKYKKYGGNFISILFFTQGFWAVFQYRIAHFVSLLKFPVVKDILGVLCLIWQKCIEILTGICIPASAKIGHSFYIGHFGGIIINANVVIGNNCNISQGVTIGVSGLNENRGVPTIGNNVYLGANCVVAGNISVGSNVVVSACSLVTRDVEPNSVVSGVPAVKISSKGSKGYI